MCALPYSAERSLLSASHSYLQESSMETKRANPLSHMHVGYFALLHALGAIGIWYAFAFPNQSILIAAAVYFFICHLSITVGAHRYFTHGSFEANRAVGYTLAIFFSGVAQGSAKWWAGKHLQHHECEDVSGEDPHTPRDGFFHSHMGWLLRKEGFGPPPAKYIMRFSKPGAQNEVIRWHQKNHRWLIPLMAFVVPTFSGLLLGDWLGGLLVIGVVRLVIQYHATWIVNSVGHTIGERGDNLATNFGRILYLPVTALLTVGEAWHANHHRSSAHWRLGRTWYEFDPGTYLIWTLSKFGLVSNLKEPADRLRVPQVKSVQ
jgi:stearoyl-CoA desaturase (Delta-9 desaturase)